MSVFSTTMSASIKLMYLLLLMMSLVTLVAGSLLYYVERGTWNPILMAYQRDYRYHCPITVDPNLPMPESHACNDPGLCQPVPGAPGEFVCLYTWKRSPDCKLERREGPYKSILHATWFVMQTITTVGFGDDVPTSPLGKSLTSILIMFGLVVVSLPITVIGAKFSHTYRAHCRTVARREEEMNFESLSLLKRVTYRLIYS